jgi:hypothetical protein
MDYESLKEQWSEIEDRDGVRLSWNIFPSSRMVCGSLSLHSLLIANTAHRKPPGLLVRQSGRGSVQLILMLRSAYWCNVHTSEGETRLAAPAV